MKFKTIQNIVAKVRKTLEVVVINEGKIRDAYSLPDFSKLDARKSKDIVFRANSINLNFNPSFIMNTKKGLILFDESEKVRGYTFQMEKGELFKEFEHEFNDSPSKAFHELLEFQKSMTEHFGGRTDE